MPRIDRIFLQRRALSAELFLWHATLLDAWGIDRGLTWNFPAWSISAEFSAYLMFPSLSAP